MANAQFLTALALPIVVYLAGFYIQNLVVGGLRSQLNCLRSDMNFRFVRLDQKFDGLTSKVVDIDNRLIRVEERLKL